MKKNNIPPHEDKPKVKKIPPKISLIKENFPLLTIMPETKRQIAINAKNKPSGSDLNQPIKPLVNIGTDTANIKEANKPAVVPPSTRTNAKTAIAVKEPIIIGKRITKSYSEELNPNNWYKILAVTCNITCEFCETSLPNGCQVFSSIHSEYAS